MRPRNGSLHCSQHPLEAERSASNARFHSRLATPTHVTIRILCTALAVAIATLAGGRVSAQIERTATPGPFIGPTLPAIARVSDVGPRAVTDSSRSTQEQDSRQEWWVSEGRTCDGCPWRRPGHAFIQTTLVNVAYGLANLARGQVTARVTPVTWWQNTRHGWVWDLDDFTLNQLGHPYQGNNYFTSGRGNGLSYWESAGVAAFGSATWEYFGETTRASLNDLINTTLGGMALGEVFYRTGWLVRDTRATGRGRLWREIAATAIDPLTGLNRFMSGDASRQTGTPAELVPSSLGGLFSVGVLWQGSNTRAVESTGRPYLDLDLLYGNLTTGRSRTPYDAFFVNLRLGGGSGISRAQVRGRLVGQSLGRAQFTITQNYDFDKNPVYQFGAQSFELNVGVEPQLSSHISVWLVGGGGLTALAAVDSQPLFESDVPLPPEGIVKLTKTRLTDPQDDELESCRDPGMLGVDQRDST